MPLNLNVSGPKTSMIGLIVVVSKLAVNTRKYSSMNTTCCAESTDSQTATGGVCWRTSKAMSFIQLDTLTIGSDSYTNLRQLTQAPRRTGETYGCR